MPDFTPQGIPPAYNGRELDLATLVANFDPSKPPPWRIRPLVIDGTLTVLAGKMGSGKTWVMHEAANAVQTGGDAGGLDGAVGQAGIIDAEMGRYLTVQRFAQQGYSTDVRIFDAIGLNLKSDDDRKLIERWVEERIGPGGFVGIDSLKRLTPTSKENESDEMSKVVSWLGALMKSVGCAGLLLHHAGWNGERIRGSSAIGDPADAVWHLTAENQLLRLACDGPDQKAPRYAPPPKPIWLKLRESGGLQAGEAPPDKATDVRLRVIDVLRQNRNLSSYEAIRELTGTADKATRGAVKQLKDDGTIRVDANGCYIMSSDEGPGV